jgi:flagellar hook-associated protein 2
MPVTMDGAMSGIDTSALINAILSSAAAPKETLEERIDDYEDKQSKITELVSLLGDLEDSLEDISDLSDFRSYAADYAENDEIEVSVDGEAVEGTYDIEVSAVASAAMYVSTTFESETDALAETGTLSLTYDDTETEITIAADTTLDDLADEINDIDGLTAYVMDTGDDDEPYRLVIQGEDGGADYDITIDESGLTGTLLDMDETVAASDAELTINGVSVTSSSNTVDDAIPGMTITLSGETSEALKVTVESDPDAIEEKIQTFVDAFNAAVSFIDIQSVFDSDEGLKGAFVGESSVRRVNSGLTELVTSSFDDLGQDYDALSLIGITTDGDGKLEIDSDTFQEILLDEPDQVADLFTDEDGFIEAMIETLDLYVDPYDGSLEVRKDSLDDRIEDMEDSIEDIDERLERLEVRLRKQFTAMESLLGSLGGSSQYLGAMMGATTG